MLYPLKFVPIFKERIWGGTKLNTYCHNTSETTAPIGECWALSALADNESVVSNGFLAGKTLNEVLAIYKEELVGAKVFEKYQYNFPLLFKFIDANDKLSIQVHPNDELALRNHGCSGKSEMWYVIDAEEGAEIILGFNQNVDKEIYLKHLNEGTLESILNKVKVKAGDAFYIPAGLVHAIGKGILLAEVQQSSDITYRLFDYNRVDLNGNSRTLHVEDALDAIEFQTIVTSKNEYSSFSGRINHLVECEYFSNNLFVINNGSVSRCVDKDSFVALMCLMGSAEIHVGNDNVDIAVGEIVLIPSQFTEYNIISNLETKFIEVVVP